MTEYGGKDLHTRVLAAITVPSAIVIPGLNMTSLPIHTSFPILLLIFLRILVLLSNDFCPYTND